MSNTLLQETTIDPMMDLYSKAAIRSQMLSGIIGYLEGNLAGLIKVHSLYTKEEIIEQLEKVLEGSKERWNELYPL